MNWIKQNIPFPLSGDLRTHDSIRPFILGFCPHANTRYKGKISDFKIYNRFFKDINDIGENEENLVLSYPLDGDEVINQNVEFTTENIEIVENVIPYRKEGRFYCLPHIDEGFVNGKWVKGETTARNEKRFVTEMQQNKINYKDEGFNKIMDVLTIDNIDDTLYPNTKFINVKMV